MTIIQYIQNINQRYQLGNATEHTFRGDLQQLIESIVPDIRATNEPKRQSCGAPDYILTKKDIPVGFIEAKDIGDNDLDGTKKTGNKEQFDRYKASLNNLIFTDYINFHLYRDGQFVARIAIGEITDKGIKPLTDNFSHFENLIKDFCTHIGQTIKSSKKLAQMMAGKARLLSEVIEKALTSDEHNSEDSTLKDQMTAFRHILIHDITPKGFADVYAQTIAYGMFAARSHDPSLDSFSRQEAYDLIPRSNPFLKKLFGYIAGLDVDDRIKWIVDDLVQIFLACNVEEMLINYGKSTKMEDPIIHFYEDFLSEYDPKLRKARGVWYTPQPVVNFIVRAVDEILKTEFDLPQGLADTSKTRIKVEHQGKKIEQEVHKVQILDPATGTGTFLAEVIRLIHKKFEAQQGIWSNYVENHLLPRLNGFELLMASYAMAHLKLDLLLTETGYKPTKDQRFRVYLTNSLEESHPDTGTLFANWLSQEANEANHIKRDTPVMCVIGNPPYNAMSKNQGKWIMKLMEDYKREPGTMEKLKERNPKMINDDYVKFIRLSQYLIEKNGEGILAFINPHGFLNSDTFRGVRWNLLNSFNKIYTIDLHGNSKKNEISNIGERDENVFDIMQGVSINIFVKKKGHSSGFGEVFYKSFIGKRNDKYDFLSNNNLINIDFEKINLKKPNFNFINSLNDDSQFKALISLNELFNFYSTGIQTDKDDFCIKHSIDEIQKVYHDIKNFEINTIRSIYQLGEDTSSWSLINAISDLIKNIDNEDDISKVQYRPFDIRFTYYTGNSNSFMSRPRLDLIKNVNKKDNLCLTTIKNSRSNLDWNFSFISKLICTKPTTITSLDANYIFPLYLYPETTTQQTIDQTAERIPNLNPEIVNQIAEKLGLTFVPEVPQAEAERSRSLAPIDILDYIYAVLHSPTYREKYKEFLKIDFPRVPYPKDKNTFWQLVKLGGQLRQIHLLESPVVEQYITQYPIDGDNIITKPHFVILSETQCSEESQPQNAPLEEPGEVGKVYINNTQYFDNVPQIAWNFYIGGYQPAQKWLKDRKGRQLQFHDILHYQKIIVALTETHRLMSEIDKIQI